MTQLPRAFVAALLCGLVASSAAGAQALTSLLSIQVRYNTLKTSNRPQGTLKAQVDSLDADIAAAMRVGHTGDLRRLYAKGLTILNGQSWTELSDYQSSLLLRSDRVVVESSKPYVVRLEQLYAPRIELTHALVARASLRRRSAPSAGASTPPMETVKELGSFDGVSRDLRESPLLIDASFSGVADGNYVIAVDVLDSARILGTATLGVVLRKGLDDDIARLESAAKGVAEPVRSDVLYPVDRMRHVNRGVLELRTFDVEKDIAAASTLVASITATKDPYAGRTGDFKRHYLLVSANEVMPYHLYIPKNYKAGRATPLIVALHGLGGTEDSFFDAYGKKLPDLAEQRGYIIAAPLGYRVDGPYGAGLGNPPADPTARKVTELSEQDVMQVLAQVRQAYTIDDSRIYLMGHSMGAIGTWKIAPKYPDIWAAIGMFSGFGAPATVDKMKHIPQFIVHGDNDPTVPVAGSRAMVAALKAAGAEHLYIEVPGGNHGNVVEPNFPAMFDFFDKHAKRAAVTP